MPITSLANRRTPTSFRRRRRLGIESLEERKLLTGIPSAEPGTEAVPAETFVATTSTGLTVTGTYTFSGGQFDLSGVVSFSGNYQDVTVTVTVDSVPTTFSIDSQGNFSGVVSGDEYSYPIAVAENTSDVSDPEVLERIFT